MANSKRLTTKRLLLDIFCFNDFNQTHQKYGTQKIPITFKAAVYTVNRILNVLNTSEMHTCSQMASWCAQYHKQFVRIIITCCGIHPHWLQSIHAFDSIKNHQNALCYCYEIPKQSYVVWMEYQERNHTIRWTEFIFHMNEKWAYKHGARYMNDFKFKLFIELVSWST